MSEANPYSFHSDVYAYGVVLFELVASRLPYDEYNNKDQILFMVGRGSLKPDITKTRSDAPPALIRLIQNCIKFDRAERPDFCQVRGAR